MNLHTRQSRRQFINRTLGTTGMLGLTTPFGRLEARDGSQVDPAALATFRARLKGRLVLPTDAGYEAARRVYFWNPDTEKRPALVVRCAHVDDVRHAVEFARRHELEVAVRGGGHSPMGWGISNGLVIDLAGMNGVTVDPARRTARVDAGVVGRRSHAAGGTPWTCSGRSGSARVSGLPVSRSAAASAGSPGCMERPATTCCPLGWSPRTDGFCRWMRSATRTCCGPSAAPAPISASSTSFECRLHPVGPVTAGDIHYPVREARPVLRFFRDLMAEAPDAFQATTQPDARGARRVRQTVSRRRRGRSGACCSGHCERWLLPTKDTVRRQEFADLAGTTANGHARRRLQVRRDRLPGRVVRRGHEYRPRPPRRGARLQP